MRRYYDKTTQIYNIGKALGAKKGDLIEYFSSDKKKTGNSWTNTNNPAEIDISHYKQLLWNTIDEILEIAGYPVEELAKEFGVKNGENGNKNKNIKNGGKAKPPRGATGGTNLHIGGIYHFERR